MCHLSELINPNETDLAAKYSIAAAFPAEEKHSSLALIVTLDGVLKAAAGQMCVSHGLPGIRTLQNQ